MARGLNIDLTKVANYGSDEGRRAVEGFMAAAKAMGLGNPLDDGNTFAVRYNFDSEAPTERRDLFVGSGAPRSAFRVV